MNQKSKRLGRLFRNFFIPLLCRLRCLRLPVIVIESSVYWTGLAYRQLFWRFLFRGRILLQLEDVIEWEWVANKCAGEVIFDPIDSVTYGVCDTFQVLPWEINEVDRNKLDPIVDLYRAAFEKAYLSLIYLNQTLRLEKVIYAQGYMTGADACRQFSLRYGIGRIAIENVADISKILWENVSGISVNKTLAKNFYYGFKGVFEKQKIQQYLCKKLDNIREIKRDEHVAGSQKTASSGYVLFLGQVYTDTSILFSARKGWAPLDVLVALANECQNNGRQLYVKLHPKERAGRSSLSRVAYKSLTYRKMQQVNGLVDNCAVVDHENSMDTFDLIRKADVVVTLNSQAGLEAALYGKPVLCCAPSNYSNLGFTYDCRDQTELRTNLKNALDCNRSKLDEISMAAAEFDYIFNNVYCIPKTNASLVNATLSTKVCI